MAKNSPSHRTFCKRIRDRRLELRLTQADVAERLGIQPPSYNAIEAGKRTPTLDTVDAVAAALDIPAEDLISARKPEVVA